ncbi:hypothetical protein SDC9_147354 [bioreactor metagenome]|uniref:Uncharacterized protein n=1 Tax=bioreactor metagenome TaxID=1076179 RepID=A0A645EFN4_9ZZZZ
MVAVQMGEQDGCEAQAGKAAEEVAEGPAAQIQRQRDIAAFEQIAGAGAPRGGEGAVAAQYGEFHGLHILIIIDYDSNSVRVQN